MADVDAHSNPAITFAIPYFRNIPYLLEAIASVRAQTVEAWELVVVDDAGPEPAERHVAAFGDQRIRCVRNATNLGLAGNWNECVRQARTPFVTVLHADDRLLPDYAARVLDAATRLPQPAAVFTDARIIDADGRPTRSLPDAMKRLARRPSHDHDVVGDAQLAVVLGNNYVMCPTLTYCKAIVGDAPFDDRWKFVLDLDHVARLLMSGERLRAVRSPLFEYRRHSGNQTSSQTADASRFAEEIRFSHDIEQRATAAGFTRSAAAARRHAMTRAHLALQTVIDLVRLRVPSARTKAVMLRDDLRHRPPASTARTSDGAR